MIGETPKEFQMTYFKVALESFNGNCCGLVLLPK